MDKISSKTVHENIHIKIYLQKYFLQLKYQEGQIAAR